MLFRSSDETTPASHGDGTTPHSDETTPASHANATTPHDDETTPASHANTPQSGIYCLDGDAGPGCLFYPGDIVDCGAYAGTPCEPYNNHSDSYTPVSHSNVPTSHGDGTTPASHTDVVTSHGDGTTPASHANATPHSNSTASHSNITSSHSNVAASHSNSTS